MKDLKKFNFDFRGVLASKEIIFPMLSDKQAPAFVRVLNLKHFVVPEVVKFIEELKFTLRPKESTGSIITLKDLNTYKIVKHTGNNFLHIFFGVREALGFGVAFNYGRKDQKIIGFLKGDDRYILSEYQFLMDTLPFDLHSEKDATWLNVSTAVYQLAYRSIALLTLLYTLYNLNDGNRIEGERGRNQEALDYIMRLSSRIKDNIGNSFFEALENLQTIGMLTW